MGIELKPCPFCGAQPEEQDIGSYFVECPGCGLQGPSGARDGVEPSVAAWNHRAVMAEVCRSQNKESDRQAGLTLTDDTQAQEPVALPGSQVAGPNFAMSALYGGRVDTFLNAQRPLEPEFAAVMQQCLDEMLDAAPQPLAPCPDDYERGKEDGWKACETCHGIVDGKHLGSVALQAKVAEQRAEIERLKSERDEYNSAWQHAGEEYRKLRDSLLSLAGAFK